MAKFSKVEFCSGNSAIMEFSPKLPKMEIVYIYASSENEANALIALLRQEHWQGGDTHSISVKYGVHIPWGTEAVEMKRDGKPFLPYPYEIPRGERIGGDPSRRLDLARCLLLLLWQGYSAGGHNCGRSPESSLLEPAMDLLGPARPEFRRKCESSVDQLLEEIEVILSAGNRSKDAHVWKDMEVGPADAEEWIEKLRQSVETELSRVPEC
jgi:hypothetical protein